MNPQTLANQIIKLLKDSGHIDQLPAIVKFLQSEVTTQANRVTLETAHQLDDQTVKQITQMLTKKLGTEPQITIKIDPDLIAGIKIRINDQLIDNSVQSQIHQLFTKVV